MKACKTYTVFFDKGVQVPEFKEGIKTDGHPKRSDLPVVMVGSTIVSMHNRFPAVRNGSGTVFYRVNPYVVKPQNGAPFLTLASPAPGTPTSKEALIRVKSEFDVALNNGKYTLHAGAKEGNSFLIELAPDQFVTFSREKDGRQKVWTVLYNEDGELKTIETLSALSRTEFGQRVILTPTELAVVPAGTQKPVAVAS